MTLVSVGYMLMDQGNILLYITNALCKCPQGAGPSMLIWFLDLTNSCFRLAPGDFSQVVVYFCSCSYICYIPGDFGFIVQAWFF